MLLCAVIKVLIKHKKRESLEHASLRAIIRERKPLFENVDRVAFLDRRQPITFTNVVSSIGR